jgi:hypothetical protein
MTILYKLPKGFVKVILSIDHDSTLAVGVADAGLLIGIRIRCP